MPHLLRKVLGLELPRLEDMKDKIQVTVEREMDNLKKVVHPDPLMDYGLHWEIQSTDEDMRRRNLLYYALFLEKHSMPLKQIVVYVGSAPPQKILQNVLEMEGLRLEFQVVSLREIPKDMFLQSEVPEEVVLAILCDFGAEQPERVIRQILQHLQKLIGRVPRLGKYQRQLQILSRLRKLQAQTKQEILSMPLHYEIETDDLYLEGIEKGIELGIEKGIERGIEKGIVLGASELLRNFIIRMLQLGELSKEKIALIADVDIAYVDGIEKMLHSDPQRD